MVEQKFFNIGDIVDIIKNYITEDIEKWKGSEVIKVRKHNYDPGKYVMMLRNKTMREMEFYEGEIILTKDLTLTKEVNPTYSLW